MVLVSLIFLSKKFLVFLVSLLVFHWMFFQYLVTAQLLLNLECRLKLCPAWLNFLSIGMALGSLTSFLWLFNCILKAASAFPTYWILKSLHSGKYMMKLLLQVVFWNILYVLLVDSNPQPHAHSAHAPPISYQVNDELCLMAYRIKWPQSSSHH